MTAIMGPCVRRDPGRARVRNRSKQPCADHFGDGGEFLIGLVELGLGRLRAKLGGKRVIFGGDDALLGQLQDLRHVLELAIDFIDDVLARALFSMPSNSSAACCTRLSAVWA